MKFIKNKFLFIILISILTLGVLIVGALSLYKDTSLTFSTDGYIIDTSLKTNTNYYFSANTKYKENVEDKITFSDKENNKVVVDPASFVHYDNGDVSFLKKGALVNLEDINNSMISYYNITNENTIVYENNHYTVISGEKKINIESFIGRINDSKYLIAGNNLFLKIPTESDRISGDYFEINYIEEGIIKIYNKDKSYQVTAQDSYIYIGESITISLGDGKIFYNSDAKMLLSQITINNDENINLDIPENNKGGAGSGSGEGAGGSGGEGEGTGTGDGEGDGSGEGDGTGSGGEGTSAGGEGSGGDGAGNGEGSNTTASLIVELIEVKVTSTTIDLTMQLNNANLARGDVLAYLTNVSSGKKEPEKNIDLTNGTFKLSYSSLTPDTRYALTIVENDNGSEKQYFQKTFMTKELGLTLEKTYATSDTLAYNLLFDENTEVTKARVTIYDNNGSNLEISPSEHIISASDLNNEAIFSGLKSNTSYSINIDTVWINSVEYTNLYTINRIDSTLKQTPVISGVKVTSNAEEVKFTIELNNIKDKDKAITSYTYNIYLADDITLDNLDPVVQYSVTKADSDALVLNLNEINELKTGVDYRCKIIAEYNDNDMIREISTDYSGNFLIRSKPNISFTKKSATMNKVEGVLTLLDANCTVPIKGRLCLNIDNNFTLSYYEASEEEASGTTTTIDFSPSKLTSDLLFADLKSNTTYFVKLYGTYYDDDGIIHPNVQIGDTFSIDTDKSDNIYFEVGHDNISEGDNVVTFDAKLSAPQDSNIMEEISTIKLNLYSGMYTNKEKLIGTYVIDKKETIQNFFSNMTISNSLFTDVTGKKLGKLNSLENLIKATNIKIKDDEGKEFEVLNSAYTVEIEDVYDSTGVNKIVVENNIYTFNLTSSYYLDSRIASYPKETYVTVTPILRKELSEEEYEKLSKSDKKMNLDDLNNDTVVGLAIENSISRTFVDSAYLDYEKVIVNYTICNNILYDCDSFMEKLTDSDLNNDKEVLDKIEIISKDMWVYQPQEEIIYLDSSVYTDARKYFIRGYKYKVGYYLTFEEKDGAIHNYNNKVMNSIINIERQTPTYTKYISESTSKDVTYRYSFNDVDSALADNNFYYTIGEDKKNYIKIENSLVDNYDNKSSEYYDVVIPLGGNTEYSLYYSRYNTNNEVEYVEVASNNFETEFEYDNNNAFEILQTKENLLKIKLLDNDINNRTIAYRVVINEKNAINNDGTVKEEGAYIRYFLGSKLNTMSIDTNEIDEEGNPIFETYKYISIDYANISDFIKKDLIIQVQSYYDSGLIGYNMNLSNGFILKHNLKNKFLNIHNAGLNTTHTEDEFVMGIYKLKEKYEKDSEFISIYNHLYDTKNYKPLMGTTYYSDNTNFENIGMTFSTNPTIGGMSLTYEKKVYEPYDIKVLGTTTLLANNYEYRFDAIVPTIDVTSNNNINSINIDITAYGIYGDEQVDTSKGIDVKLYSDEECNNLITTKNTKIKIDKIDSGYNATISSVSFNNLTPNTKYYFKVFAYVNNEYVGLYDKGSSVLDYVSKTYDSSTLNSKGIIKSIKLHVEPFDYDGEFSKKKLTWKLDLNNTDNYKLRFELYKPNGSHIEINEETGEEIVITDYEQVMFDGSDASSCNIDTFGTNDNGYVNNCYISVDKDSIKTINKKDMVYNFGGNDFVFGGNYYKLLVYAIPYTNNSYIEEEKLLLYQNDSLTSTPSNSTGINGVPSDIKINELKEVVFSLGDSLTANFDSESEEYYVSLIPTVYDEHKVIKYGSYTINLKDENGTIIDSKTKVKAGIDNIKEEIKFTDLSPNTLYYVELTYEAYRNNFGYSDSQKVSTTPFTDFIYTPIISDDIILGNIVASRNNASELILTYNGSANLVDKVVKVEYTISLKGSNNMISGIYSTLDNLSIFTLGSDRIPKLKINTSNTSFALTTGNTYIINTLYYYLEDGKEVLVRDEKTGKTTFTTILNL